MFSEIFNACTKLGQFLRRPSTHPSVSASQKKTSYWSDIPIEILDLIAKRLELADCVRLRAVCKSWIPSRIEISDFPWLMLPLHKRYNDKVSFFDFISGIIHSFNFPESVRKARIITSSKGWFIMARGTMHFPVLFLFDPIWKMELPLPPICSIPGYRELVKEHGLGVERFIHKLVLSSVDASKCVVAAICNYADVLAISRPGADAWDLIQASEGSVYRNLSFSSRDTTVLLVLIENEYQRDDKISTIIVGDLRVRLIPMTWPQLNRSVIVHPEDKLETVLSISKESIKEACLFESAQGEIIIVNRIMDRYYTGYDYLDENDQLQEYANDDGVTMVYEQTCRFLVFKVEEANGRLIKQTKLERLEDCMLFVGPRMMCTLYIPTMERSKRNCVFYLGEETEIIDVQHQPPCNNDNGVFYIDNGRIERFIPSIPVVTHTSMAWFQPNLGSIRITRTSRMN